MHRVLARGLGAAIAVLVIAAPAATAAPMKFKATVYVFQGSDWTASFTNRVCGSYEHSYSGSGGTTAIYSAKDIPVTFKRQSGGLATNAFAMKGSLTRTASYTASDSGDKSGCAPGAAVPPPPIDTSACGLKRVRRSGKDFQLVVIGGRLGPFGAFSGNGGANPFGGACPDQSLVSAGIDMPTSKQRRDVHKLLARKRVRSISLDSGGLIERTIPERRMGFPATDTQSGSGTFEGRWTVKLTRVR